MIVDTEKVLKLIQFLTQQDEEGISIEAHSLLQSGLVYIFNVNIECIGEYQCNVDATHELTFHYAPLHCKISTNHIALDNMDPKRDLNFALTLDGETFTYDPDDASNNALQWGWNCVDPEQESCEYLLDSVDSGIINIDLSRMTFEYNTHYLFTVHLSVSAHSNCMDSFVLEIDTKSNANENEYKSLIVTVTSIASEITRNDRLRLLGNVVNYNLSEFVYFEWKELNGLLTENDIAYYRQTSTENVINLILKENVLESGKMYSFQLIVTEYDGYDMENVIGYGISVPITVYVLKEPVILSGSFHIEPQCNYEYTSITELMSTSYSLGVSADGDYTPLLYIFGYEDHYFDSLNIYQPFLSNVYLPIGDFSIFVHVIDSRSSTISDEISCSISLQSYSECLDFDSFLANNNPMISSAERSLYELRQSINYLQYLYRYDKEGECVETSLHSIIHIIYENNITLCHHNSYLILLLSESITLWMDLVSTDVNLIEMFYKDNTDDILGMLTQILIQILDPCSYISNSASMVQLLRISPHSIVTKIAKIYYNEADVTTDLSPIITNPNYHHLLYSLASSMIDVLDESMLLYNVLSDSLYISQLIRVSLSIPYESSFTQFNAFSMYSVRVNNENVDISVNGISVSVPKDVTNTGNGIELFDAVDVLIIGINSSSNNVSTNIADDSSECDDFEGILSSNSVSITLIGNNTNTSHLLSNINFTFLCDEENGCDDTFQCSWYNKEDDIWQNNGCNTMIHYDNIECSCNHLTTFSTIHNIHSYKCQHNDFVDEWLKSWNGFNICIAAIFLVICLFAIKDVYPFCKTKTRITFKTHKSVFAVILIGITAFLYVLLYIVAFITKISIQKGVIETVSIPMYTLLLLLPQITLFMLFTLIFYTWFGLAHSFLQNLEDLQTRVKYALFAVNVFIWCFLIVYYAFILIIKRSEIFEIAAYIWSIMLSIAAIFITIYCVLVSRVLYKTAQISQNQSFAQKDWQIVRRLLTINVFITMYFIFQAFTTIYLAINSQYQSVIFSILYSFIDVLCLLFIFWLYRGSVRGLREQEQSQLLTTQYRQQGPSKRFERVISNTATCISSKTSTHSTDLPPTLQMSQRVPSVSTDELSKRTNNVQISVHHKVIDDADKSPVITPSDIYIEKDE